jgi:hypothetical protein
MTTKKKDDEVVPDFEIPYTSYAQILHAAGVDTDPAVEFDALIAAGDAKAADLTPKEK